MKSAKRIIVSLILLAIIGNATNLYAQDAASRQMKAKERIEQRVGSMVSQMSKDLKLTDKQQQVVFDLSVEKNMKNYEDDKTLTTAEEKKEAHSRNWKTYNKNMQSKLPKDLVEKIRKWELAYHHPELKGK